MCFCTARVIRNAPRRCTPITVSQSASVNRNSRLSRVTPALFTRTVGEPSSVGDPLHRTGHRLSVGDVDETPQRSPPE